MSVAASNPDRRFMIFNALLSAAALASLGWLLLLRDSTGGSLDLRFMPAVNAGLNSLSATLLTLGYVAVRRGRADIHRYLMVSALVTSLLFLAGYVAYHYAHGDTKYTGEGVLRLVYFAVLITHVLLSMVMVPMVLSCVYFAWRQRFDRHRKLARVTLPIWLYVSVTGVVIYFMLHG